MVCVMFGYAGRLLEVDLSKNITNVKNITQDFCREFLGGLGFASKLAFEIKRNADPLSPENNLILAIGPLSGTPVPFSSGVVFATKSPLNNGFCYDILYGDFATEMRMAGYDAIVIKGKAESLRFLYVSNNRRQIKDARQLIGKSPTECEIILKDSLEDPFVKVASIGIAGEKMVECASVISGQKMVGRGIGAVMGSKNLKAIAIRGTNRLNLAKPDELYAFSQKAIIDSKVLRGVDKNFGPLFDISQMNSICALPTENFRKSAFQGVDKLVHKLNERYFVKVNACPSCPLACEYVYKVDDEYGQIAVRLDYSAFWAFGPNCAIDHVESILKATELCYFYGLDVTQTGGLIGFMMECSEEKLLMKEIQAGELRFGDPNSLLKIIHDIGNRRDLGELLAKNPKSILNEIKNSDSLATCIKGFQLPGCDPRASRAIALFYAVSPCADFPLAHGMSTVIAKKILTQSDSTNAVVKLVKDCEDMISILNSMVLCLRCEGIYGGLDKVAQAYTLATGIEIDGEYLKKTGERINDRIRLFNVREGLNRDNDILPSKFFNGERALVKKEFELLLDAYYKERGWT